MDIAILEDEPAEARIVQLYLESAGHNCKIFTTGRSIINKLPGMDCDLLIIDWELPDISGDNVLHWVRDNIGWNLPVVFVTGHDSTEDIVTMLDAGADDYITKPVNLKEMLARVNALGRRTEADKKEVENIAVGSFIVDFSCHRLTSSGKEIELTSKEFKLASYLFGNVGSLVSREKLLLDIWGYGKDVQTRTIDIHMSRIRKKLSLVPENGWRLTSIYHEGYRLDKLSKDEADKP